MPLDNKPLKHMTFGRFSGSVEAVSCPICSFPPEPKRVYTLAEGVGIWLCEDCGLMYASPRFTEKSLLEIYENNAFVDPSFYEKWSYEKWKSENPGRSYISQLLKIQLIRRFLNDMDPVLDVGCGTGLFCLEASKQGLNVEGIDPSEMLIKIGRKKFGISLHHGHLQDFDPGHRYKGIVVWAVLEHVYNPTNLVKKCGELLEEGGYLFLDVPNYGGVSNRFKTFLCRKGLKKSNFRHFGFPWHVYSFNKQSLSALMNICNFTPIQFEFWSHLLKENRKGPIARFIIWMNQKYELSDYITLVARKRI